MFGQRLGVRGARRLDHDVGPFVTDGPRLQTLLVKVRQLRYRAAVSEWEILQLMNNLVNMRFKTVELIEARI